MTRWNIDASRTTQILSELTAINSMNSFLVAGGPDEGEAAAWLVRTCNAMGLEVWTEEPAPNRPNVYARWQGSGGGKSMLLTGHTDVVGIEGMTIEPFKPEIRDGNLYGRGSYDMKAGLAAILGAVEALQRGGFQPKGDVLLGFVVDEEYSSLGTTAMVKSIQADGCILTEPSALQIGLAHKGFAWVTLTTHGLAAHGSLHEVGIDAITHMGYLLTEIDRLEREVMPTRTHPLLGRPSLHASLINGGLGASTYPDACTVKIEHRPLPDQDGEYIKGLWDQAIERLSKQNKNFKAEAVVDLYQPGFETGKDQPIVQAVDAGYHAAMGSAPTYRGMFGWLDSAIISRAGIPVVVYGPSGEGAHAAVEYADLDSVARCAAVLAESTALWCG
jgi:acetylornithine deacetylase